MKKKLKICLYIIFVLILIVFLFVYFSRRMMSSAYSWLSDVNEISWSIYEVENTTWYISRVFIPMTNPAFKLNVKWWWLTVVFFVYKFFGKPEYKLLSKSFSFTGDIFEVKEWEKLYFTYDWKGWISSFPMVIRNTFLDRWWKFLWIIVQIFHWVWENVYLEVVN